jgi:hypothetical protein
LSLLIFSVAPFVMFEWAGVVSWKTGGSECIFAGWPAIFGLRS